MERRWHLQQHPLDTADQAVPLKTGSCEFGGRSGLGDRWEARSTACSLALADAHQDGGLGQSLVSLSLLYRHSSVGSSPPCPPPYSHAFLWSFSITNTLGPFDSTLGF